MMDHTLYKCVDCQKPRCQFCDGGLAFCTVCKGAEATLTSTCTGIPLSEDQGRLIQSGKLDFKDGKWVRFGQLAREFCNKRLPLAVLKSNAGYYIGTFDEEGPCSRESVEYFSSSQLAAQALAAGEWTQKPYP